MFVTIGFMSPRRVPVSRRDRPAKPALSREGVVAVALRVMREEGLERVTMRRLAAELDTGPASLYVYVANVAELHGALLDELIADLDADDLAGLLCDYTAVLVRHPALARSVLALWPSGPHYMRLVDRLLGLLRAAGVAPRQAAWGVDVLLQHAVATAAEQGTRDESPDDAAYGLTAALAEASAESYPHIVALRDELFSGTGEQRLRWQFAALIAGIAATGTP
jgi:AcrR family transcriptional regulator